MFSGGDEAWSRYGPTASKGPHEPDSADDGSGLHRAGTVGPEEAALRREVATLKAAFPSDFAPKSDHLRIRADRGGGANIARAIRPAVDSTGSHATGSIRSFSAVRQPSETKKDGFDARPPRLTSPRLKKNPDAKRVRVRVCAHVAVTRARCVSPCGAKH